MLSSVSYSPESSNVLQSLLLLLLLDTCMSLSVTDITGVLWRFGALEGEVMS